MDLALAACATVTGLAGLFISFHVWRTDRARETERQARLVSAWVVREAGDASRAGGGELRGVVVCNGSDAPVSQVCVRVRESSASEGADAGQMFAQVPPGTYYVQRNDDPEQPWSAPYAVDSEAGSLTVTLPDERVRLVPVTEVPASDTFDRQWWRVDDGRLTDRAPRGWNLSALRLTARRDLAAPTRRGRSADTDALARLLRRTVNLTVAPDRRVDESTPAREDVPTTGGRHRLAAHVRAFGLSGGTGMGVRLLTDASDGDRARHVYYLEAGRDGVLPAKFFYGHLARAGRPDQVVTPLRDQLLARGRTTDDWTPESLADALAEIIEEHQSAAVSVP